MRRKATRGFCAPPDILLGYNGDAKLADFELARSELKRDRFLDRLRTPLRSGHVPVVVEAGLTTGGATLVKFGMETTLFDVALARSWRRMEHLTLPSSHGDSGTDNPPCPPKAT